MSPFAYPIALAATLVAGLCATATAAEPPAGLAAAGERPVATERRPATPAEALGVPPLGRLPPAPSPRDNPTTAAKVELGRMLFWDGRLSDDGSSPCVACHEPRKGWGDAEAISGGHPGTRHWRNSQTILNSAYYDRLFWDGSVTSLEAQAPAAAEGAVAGNADPSLVEMRLRFVPEYVRRFREVFGTEWPRITQAWQAIAAFQRTIVTDPARVPFDRYLAGDRRALSESALRGWDIFERRANCLECHYGPLASDGRFHALAVPEPPAMSTDPVAQITHRWQQVQRGVTESAYRNAGIDMGLHYQTKNPKDIGKFRTPSLRELKHTAPYMHNGTLATLEEVVDFYDRGDGTGANKSLRVRTLGLTVQERRDLVAFLEALSMDELPPSEPPVLPPYAPLDVSRRDRR